MKKSKKKKNPAMKKLQCGCMMQEPTVVEKNRKLSVCRSLFFGTHNVYKLAELLYTRIHSDRMVLISGKRQRASWKMRRRRKYPFKAGVNIMYGCAIISAHTVSLYVRGREREAGNRRNSP